MTAELELELARDRLAFTKSLICMIIPLQILLTEPSPGEWAVKLPNRWLAIQECFKVLFIHRIPSLFTSVTY